MGFILLECLVRISVRIPTFIAEVLLWFLLAPSVKSRDRPFNYATTISLYVIPNSSFTITHTFVSIKSDREATWKDISLNIVTGYYYCYYGSTALCWALAAFSVSWSYTQSVGLLGRGISPLQSLYLRTEQYKHTINAHNIDMHVLSGIRTHDRSVRADEDGSCLRPRGHCYRLVTGWPYKIFQFYQSGWSLRNPWSQADANMAIVRRASGSNGYQPSVGWGWLLKVTVNIRKK
jgi:hypothetical protein